MNTVDKVTSAANESPLSWSDNQSSPPWTRFFSHGIYDRLPTTLCIVVQCKTQTKFIDIWKQKAPSCIQFQFLKIPNHKNK